jgi:hypothetical protein
MAERLMQLLEDQYRYGAGSVVVRRPRAIREVDFEATPWVQILAEVACGSPERHGHFVERDLYVPMSLVQSLLPSVMERGSVLPSGCKG